MAEATDTGEHGSEIILVSMLEHYAYCPRQFALIHIEQVFEGNIFTLKGRQDHERVNEPESGEIDGVRFERSLPIYSHRLGLSGVADLVEFPNEIPYPVEYKHSWRRGRLAVKVQLCAQAFCLEEMFDKSVSQGVIYSIKSHKRFEVEFSERLRAYTLVVLAETRNALAFQKTPLAVNDARCKNCSLIDVCLPELATAV
jgi:CRISPR-associated exonuclease Cas4